MSRIVDRALWVVGLQRRGAPDGFDDRWYGAAGSPSASGVSVTAESAMRCAAVYACVRLLAGTIAQLPLVLYRRNDAGRDRAPDHPLYRLIHSQPNPETCAMTFWETMAAHVGLRGNAYAVVIRKAGRARDAVELWPVSNPDRVTPKRDGEDGPLYYEYRTAKAGQTIRLRPDQILHLRGTSLDGITGLSPLSAARESIGLSVAAQDYGSKLFSNGSRPGGILLSDKVLGAKYRTELREDWERMHAGLDNAHRVAVLENGLKWQAVSISPEDAQLLDTRKFQVVDICRIFGVPPHMIGEEGNPNRASGQVFHEQFLKYSLQPWLTRIAQQVDTQLLWPDEREELYCEHVVESLLRTDIKTRFEAYGMARQWGFMSANDVRTRENMPPLPGEDGDQFMVPVNMQPASLSLAKAQAEVEDPVRAAGDDDQLTRESD